MLKFIKNLFSLNNSNDKNKDALTTKTEYINHKIKKASSKDFDYNLFILRLRETATWLEYVTPYNGSKLYRSVEIQPYDLLLEIVSSEINNYYEQQKEIVTNVAERRTAILNKKGIPLLELDEVLQKGYILYCYVNQTVTDGASEYHSNCFFDVYDIPAWDTWTWWYESDSNEILVAWIPEKLVQHVANGVDVNCVDCIRWAAYSSEKLTTLLFQNNLIRTPAIDSATTLQDIVVPEYESNIRLLEEIHERVKNKKQK